MKRWLGIIVIIALIFTACGGDNDEGTKDESTNDESNADFSALYGKWTYTPIIGTKETYIISENEIEHYRGSSIHYKCEIQTVKKVTNSMVSKNEYPEGFWIETVITEDGDPTDEYYIVGSSRSHFFYLNINNNKMEIYTNIYIKVVE